MADDEQFSLCWNNFNSNLSAGFHESLCRGDLVDVTLAAEGQFVKAHRLVLSVCSPYFRRMFTQMPANQHAFVFLKDVSHSALKDLIQFMYCGEVNVKQDALPAFISTAEALQIKGLTDGEPAPSQSPAKPSTPAPQQTIPATTMTASSPRVRTQRSTISRSSYKLESEDSGDENKSTTQIVLQPSQSQQTLVQQSQKRPAQRSITPHTIPSIKRIKNNDPLEATDPTQISVQTVADSKSSSGEPEFIDLPIDLPTKSEPDYAEEAGDVETAEQEATYVEDDSYGDMKYDESYFTENDESATAPTTSATVKQSGSFSESYVSDAGDQSTTETQVRRRGRPKIKPKSYTIKELAQIAFKNESHPVVYVSTIKGGMTILFDGHHFKHLHKRDKNTFYRCVKHESTKCLATLLIHEKRVYPAILEHNHKDLAISAAATGVPGVISQPIKLENEIDQTIEPIILSDDTISIPLDGNFAEEPSDNGTSARIVSVESASGDQSEPKQGAKASNLFGADLKEKMKKRLENALRAAVKK